MKYCLICLFCFSGLLAAAQPNRDCRMFPVYTTQVGFDYKRAYFSTTERKIMGLAYLEMPAKAGEQPRVWQHPSWKKAGWLGPMAITDKGDVWAAPVPRVNVFDNKPMEQNWLWKADSRTGELNKVLAVPRPDSAFNTQNPFGIIGLAYDCDNGMIYTTSVAGSTMDTELGRIFAIRTSDNKIVDQIDSLDAFGIGIGTINGQKRCYYGSARSGDIWSVGLKADGGFDCKPRIEFSLEGLGPRGDDRARKIRIALDETLTINGVEFYFNLTAPTEKQESAYTFRYLPNVGKWQLIGIQ